MPVRDRAETRESAHEINLLSRVFILFRFVSLSRGSEEVKVRLHLHQTEPQAQAQAAAAAARAGGAEIRSPVQ